MIVVLPIGIFVYMILSDGNQLHQEFSEIDLLIQIMISTAHWDRECYCMSRLWKTFQGVVFHQFLF